MNTNNRYEGIFRIVAVGDVQEFASGFRKRELLVTDDAPKYPTTFPVEFSGDNCDKAGAFRPHDHAAIAFAIRGHQTAAGRAFVTIRAFKIERAAKLGGEPTVTNAPPPAAAPAPNANLDELPF